MGALADIRAVFVRSRNLLDYEHTGLALTRIYAVEHLQVEPPSPPGYVVKDSVKHFTIIKDPAPPPPPNPPPSPPLYPPPPLPSFLGTRMETHIECTFEENMDFSITSTTAGSYADRKAETQKHCCSLCGMEPGCTNFVYEPASKTCVLLPHVPSSELVKTPNPSTVAGSVTISHISNYHASCEFEVGSGYSGGSLGMGVPLSGMKIATKQACCTPLGPSIPCAPTLSVPLLLVQDCCDACERDAKCAKFSFEIFSGTCEMFESYSEHYFTSGLASGIVTSRAAKVSHAGVGDDAERIVDLIVPPAPPSLVLQLAASSPPPVGDDIGLRVVADMSLSAIFIMISGFLICLYCFFSPQLNALLYKVSNGKLGKASRSLIVGQHSSGGMQGKASKKHRRKQHLEEGWAAVTVQTSQLSQNKDVEVAGCETLEELRDVIWEEFGHLLNGIKRPKKDTVILCLTGSDEASGQGWQLVTAASDLARVVECGALKLMEKVLIDVDTLSIAFSRSLPAPKRGARGAPALLAHRDRNADDDTDDDTDEEAPGARRGRGGGKGEFEPLVAASSSDEGEGSCKAGSDNKANARQKARGQARSARKPKGADAVQDASRARETLGSKRPTKDAPSSQQGPSLQMDAAPPVPTGDFFDNAPERSNALPQTRAVAAESDATTAFIGKRVRIHGLATMGELNGQIGLAKSYDQTKQRYRVQLVGPNGPTKVLGFKPANLQPL